MQFEPTLEQSQALLFRLHTRFGWLYRNPFGIQFRFTWRSNRAMRFVTHGKSLVARMLWR